MNKSIFRLLMIFTASLLSFNAYSQNYELIWSEDFNSPELNMDVWSFEEGYIRNNEKQYYTVNRAENCRIEDGKLIIEARKEKYKDFDFTAASVTTKKKKNFLYGRIEVRAKLPTGRGTWPAIWMLGCNIDEVGWPMCGEIDIMENVGFDPDVVHGNVHTKAYNHMLKTNKGNHLENKSLYSDYHVYAIDWTEDKIEFFLDGEKYFTFENDKKGDLKTWPYSKAHYLILNFAVGGMWGGEEGIDESIFPQKYYIDYVKHYRIVE